LNILIILSYKVAN